MSKKLIERMQMEMRITKDFKRLKEMLLAAAGNPGQPEKPLRPPPPVDRPEPQQPVREDPPKEAA